ncbi:MAG TPA: NfeD family protein [Anaerolineales bacterium]|nr:NfeD family protein [Anaerolineales bacterium]
MTQYSMTPVNNGTRLRSDHNTSSSVVTSYNRGQLIVGDEIWEATADGSEVKKGDKWLHVTSVDGVNLTDMGWMAYIHKGVPVCNNFKEISDPTPPPPVFPESFTLTDPSGAKAEYVFVRIIE